MVSKNLIIVGLITLFILTFIIGGIALTGLILGGIIFFVFLILFNKLPIRLQKFMVRHHIITDALFSILTFFSLGGGIHAVVAAAYIGIFISLALWFLQDKIHLMP